MSDEKDLQQLKKEAAERAKQLARERMAAKKETEQTEQTLEKTVSLNEEVEAKQEKTAEKDDDLELAKKKAAAAAKAKAAALAKQKAKEAEQSGESADSDELAKQKAIAAAKAKAAAAAKAKAAALAKQQAQEGNNAEASEDEIAKAKAKAIAAAKAKAAAAAKAKAAQAQASETPKQEEKPSPNQVYLDKYVKVIKEHLGEDVLEDAYINRLSKDVPTLVAKKDTYYKIAQFLKYNEQLGFDYLSDLHGTDFQTHMEVYVHLYSYKNNQSVALKVKIDRDNPEIDSLVPLWPGANWPECEAYDLLGIQFKGHPNLIRIFLGENWVGHPLRKDYEPYDVEV
ncbi:NADH dehydrogenase subunit C [Anoxybacillus vitaminiphilus]|jgi:NADH-quinone oxidoreductase subunit C|uniref:NAD(P)H dehydrogenase subunit J n=1 Tax=Paranoxybacillus vitaminiphilus TaxID=581036 RepID=A0A327YHN3_9BACL|nr:NADH-quinone oxidoreductase subunit C [Anoxybacillus vitaminiphilus]RAK20433.1 NADH dehydrogenase subunit C [Anoxybacillus vitaminiphilus]